MKFLSANQSNIKHPVSHMEQFSSFKFSYDIVGNYISCISCCYIKNCTIINSLKVMIDRKKICR